MQGFCYFYAGCRHFPCDLDHFRSKDAYILLRIVIESHDRDTFTSSLSRKLSSLRLFVVVLLWEGCFCWGVSLTNPDS